LALTAAAFQTGCFPASWGAATMLHPWRNPLKTARPAGAEHITFTSDGVQLKGWLFRGSGARRGTIIYLHGIADNRASGVSITDRYLPRGFDVLLYDSRAHGESGGAACTYGYYERKDLIRAIDLVPSKPVVLIGVSLGAAVALQAAAEDRRIAAVISAATFSDLRSIVAERAPFIASKADIEGAFRFAEAEAHFRVDDVSPVKAAARIQVPVLVIHGAADHKTSPQNSQRVFDAFRGPKRLILVPGADHMGALQPDVWEQIDAWIDRYARFSEQSAH
jgi:alpha-beta hydrolase superfamily lysophospholipase